MLLFNYSEPPNTEPWSVFRLDLMPVPNISNIGPFENRTKKSGFQMVKTRLFYYKENIFYDPFINKTV